MLLGIDHIVVVVHDLEKAAKDYEQLGFTVIPGGKHPVGSHNALISFADGSYIEIIAFYREAPDHRWWKPLQSGERMVDFCMQTDNLQEDTRKLRAAGVAINDPVPWSRTRPDGYELKWLLSLVTGDERGVWPFLIQDVTPREERIPQKFQHKNGALGIGTLSITVRDLAKIHQGYEAILGATGMSFSDDLLDAGGLSFTVGPHTLEFVAPTAPAGLLVDWLRTYGPSSYAATLLAPSTTPQLLDLSLTHGANLSFGN